MGLVKDAGEKSGSKRANHRWELSSLYIKNIIEAGEKADADFTEHFSAAMEFFSKYCFMGEIGTYILARLGSEHKPLFRVKHEYFAQALNDCNLLDFLNALENKKWCKIRYRNSLLGVETELICYPLGIRISTTGGREYVTFYEPFKRNYSHLRLEFVDTVEFIAENSIKEGGRTISLDDSTVQKDIAKALKLIKKTWGAAGPNINSLDDDPPISEISFDINFYPKTEQFIPARAEREKRIGTVEIKDGKAHFSAEVISEGEMQPWIRSFYSRITNFSDKSNIEGFSVQNDVDEILAQNECEKPLQKILPKSSAKVWGIPEGCICKTEKKPAYSLIFHEIFGIYYQLMGE
ncbi:MAG: WYL domain-containing protein, partial [Ruminiclostridium sp.]|nr:WYL domain-containing protein [Ruminiclostridium sp.]